MPEKTDPQDEREFGEIEGDDICPDCDGTGENDGRMCRACRGKGYVQQPHSK
jgi:DnaJ-class molecular chaperone